MENNLVSAGKAPHILYRVSELSFVKSLKNWTNTKVKVLGRIKFLPNDCESSDTESSYMYSEDDEEKFHPNDTPREFDCENIFSKLLNGERKSIFKTPRKVTSDETDTNSSLYEKPEEKHVQQDTKVELENSINWNNESFYGGIEHDKTVDLMTLWEDDVTDELAKYEEAIFKDGIFKFANLLSIGEQDSGSKIMVDVSSLNLHDTFTPVCNNRLVFLFGDLEVIDGKPLLYCQIMEGSLELDHELQVDKHANEILSTTSESVASLELSDGAGENIRKQNPAADLDIEEEEGGLVKSDEDNNSLIFKLDEDDATGDDEKNPDEIIIPEEVSPNGNTPSPDPLKVVDDEHGFDTNINILPTAQLSDTCVDEDYVQVAESAVVYHNRAGWCDDCGCVAAFNDENGNAEGDEDAQLSDFKPTFSELEAQHLPDCKHYANSKEITTDFKDKEIIDVETSSIVNSESSCSVSENLESITSPCCDIETTANTPEQVEQASENEKLDDSLKEDVSCQSSVIPAAFTNFDGAKLVVVMQGQSEHPLDDCSLNQTETQLNSRSNLDDECEKFFSTSNTPQITTSEILNKDVSTNSPVFELNTKETAIELTNISNKISPYEEIALEDINSVANISSNIKANDFKPSTSLDSDPLGISCGFSSLGSVLFEKCKYRRDNTTLNSNSEFNCNSNESTDNDPCNKSQRTSCQLQSCSLADTPLYVPENLPSPDIDNEFISAKCSSIENENSEVQKMTTSSSDDCSSISSSENSSSSFIRSSPGRRRVGFIDNGSSLNSLHKIEEQDALSSPLLTTSSQNKQNFRSVSTTASPIQREIKSDIVSTGSAPCSPIPQAPASIYSGERRRKLNTCARRRVSFPEDDRRLITSYLEPADPWERMKTNVTSEEVLAAYNKSCSIHRSAPIPAVVNQITALPLNIPGRIECFSLKNCKLELSQCEGLEEVLKRVQFITIDLESCSLTDETMIPLLDMMEFYDSATQINISCNSNIGSRGWQACARMIKKTQSVCSLEARQTNLNELHMPILGKALKLTTKLHTLHLENCNLTGRPLVTLTAALRFNETLVKLYLADNRLGSSDCIQICNLMRSNLTLKLLDLRNNNLQDAGCAHVCEGVADQSKPSGNLASLSSTDARSNKVDRTGLSSLVLWNNHITVNSLKNLSSMVSATKTLQTLNIGRNSVTNDGIIRLKESLLRNKSLKRLYLHATKIGDEGAVALAEFIAESKNIERVDLRENSSIKVAGLMALAHSLRHNTSVVQMDLDTNPRSEPLTELVEQHVNFLQEIKDYTHRNRVQAHLVSSDSKNDVEVASNNLDPDSRKLSLCSSDMNVDINKASLEVPIINSPVNLQSSNFPKLSSKCNDDHKKYRSPSPSPCSSPTPSPSPSPTPSPLRNRFKVLKVSDDLSPTSPSVMVTANPLYNNSSLSVSSNCLLSSSAPTCSVAPLSTTSRPVYYQPQTKIRNRFASGGRFTVTKVTDSSSLPDDKHKSCSLPAIPNTTTSPTSVEPSSPKIVISSPVKIERGFSVDETSSNSEEKTVSLVESIRSVSSSNVCTPSNNSDQLNRMKSDSSESDDVFVDINAAAVVSNSPRHIRRSKSDQGVMACAIAGALSPSNRRELTDSGFLEEPNSEIEEAISSLRKNGPNCSSYSDADRDSLFSNSSDQSGGHSPSVLSPDCRNILPLSTSNKVDSCSGDQNSIVIRKSGIAQGRKAPLACMENGSFDTDSEDSEVTTQSSDSTHSDEVRIAATDVVPQQAWGLVSIQNQDKNEKQDEENETVKENYREENSPEEGEAIIKSKNINSEAESINTDITEKGTEEVRSEIDNANIISETTKL